jgi:hypothetical protein
VLKKIYAKSASVFVQGNNLAIFTDYPGTDPDLMSIGGTSGSGYPSQRTFSIGFNMNF